MRKRRFKILDRLPQVINMKKIIEHGYKYNMETKCPSCGCLFSYEWEDVIKPLWEWNYVDHSYFYFSNPPYRISCPECGTEFNLINWNFTKYNHTIDITCSCKEENNND